MKTVWNGLYRIWANGYRGLSYSFRATSYAGRHPVRVIAIFVVLAGFATFVNWIVTTGGAGFDKPIAGGSERRTLWDWLELLLIPGVIGAGWVMLNLILQRRTVEEQNKDRDIALDRSRDQTLRHYLDIMQELILDRHLEHGADLGVRQVARARTIAAAIVLDTERFDQVITFLRDAELLDVIDEDEDESGVMHGIPNPAVTFGGANFSAANWPGVNLGGLNLADANLSKSILRGTYLGRSKLFGVNLGSADLQEADFTGADLTHANLEEANLAEGNLENASLSWARLGGADFSGADLTGAVLENADSVTDRQLNSASSLVAVTLPDGTRVPEQTSNKELPDKYRVRESNGHWTFERHRWAELIERILDRVHIRP